MRDIVQFVPFNEFKNDPKKLAETTLKGNFLKLIFNFKKKFYFFCFYLELPDQVRQYYGLQKISPYDLNNN